MAQVELNDVGKSYGLVDVIERVNLTLEDGGFTVFVGPSGCGKSTLLRMIAGLEPITRGEIVIDGAVVNRASPTERGIAMVFQNYALYPHMTVRDNIAFPLKMAGMTRAMMAERVETAARNLKIEHLLDRKPAELSGGQRQRVAIGRSIVRQPKVFLFDEPLSNLDAELRVQMRMEIGKLHRDLAATMVYVTHDQVEAMTLADRIVVMRAGAIEQVGTPIQLYDDPDNVFVAGFIGSPQMNFLTGRIVGKDDAGLHLTFGKQPRFIKPVALSEGLQIGQEVLIGIRPDEFVDGGSASLSIIIDWTETLGNTVFAHGRSETGEAVIVDLRARRSLQPDQSFETAFDPAKAYLFDKASGRRIR
jgi:lactose/L-arabinose transport system ATP-binding protein